MGKTPACRAMPPLGSSSTKPPQISGNIFAGLFTLGQMLLKSPSRPRRKGPPPGETGQEHLYLRFLSEKQIPVTVKLRDGEAVYGWIEYSDDRMIRLTREGKPNLFIYKEQIRTITESFRNIEARKRDRNRAKDRISADGAIIPPAGLAIADGSPTRLIAVEPKAIDGISRPDIQPTQGGS
jgi:host factor-I protein